MSTGEYSEGEYTPSESTLADPLSPTPSFPSQPPLLQQSSSRALLLEESPFGITPTQPHVSSRRVQGDSSMDSQIRFESPRNNNNAVFHRPPFTNSESELTSGTDAGDYILPRNNSHPLETSSLLGYKSMSYGGNSADSSKVTGFADEDPLYYKSLISLFCSIVFIIGVVCVIALQGFSRLWAQRDMPRFAIKSDWKNGAEIPTKYGCKAAEPISIPLSWENVPDDATNLVVLFSSRYSNEINWIITDIPLKGENKVGSLIANASAASMPNGAHELANSHSRDGHYSPPCHSHIFDIHAYAIDDHAKIARKNLLSSLKIIKSFVGVPTATYSGTYTGAHGNIDENHHGDTGYANDHEENDEQSSSEDHDSSQNGYPSEEEEHKSPDENEHASEEGHGEPHEDVHASEEEEHETPHENEHASEEELGKPTQQDHSLEVEHESHAPMVSHKRSRRTWRENLRKYL